MPDIFSELRESVIDLDEGRVKKATEEAIAQRISPQDIIAKGLMEGMKEVGERFERRDFFLPELIACGEVMKAAFGILRPLLAASKEASLGKVLLGTVQGDIHDIGKNIIGQLLESNGFELHDIGVDVPAETFVSKAKEIEPDVIALSALLSGAISKAAETVMALRENGIQSKIIIGGAATTQEVAEDIGADAHGKDAWEGVQKVQQLVFARRQK